MGGWGLKPLGITDIALPFIVLLRFLVQVLKSLPPPIKDNNNTTNFFTKKMLTARCKCGLSTALDTENVELNQTGSLSSRSEKSSIQNLNAMDKSRILVINYIVNKT